MYGNANLASDNRNIICISRNSFNCVFPSPLFPYLLIYASLESQACVIPERTITDRQMSPTRMSHIDRLKIVIIECSFNFVNEWPLYPGQECVCAKSESSSLHKRKKHTKEKEKKRESITHFQTTRLYALTLFSLSIHYYMTKREINESKNSQKQKSTAAGTESEASFEKSIYKPKIGPSMFFPIYCPL